MSRVRLERVLTTVEKAASVLLVDDDAYCLDESQEALTNLGYDVACATDAMSALKMIADNPDIGIVITDLRMPGMDGHTFLEELALRFMPKRPIVALVVTGIPSLEAATLAMRYRAMDFLSKPVSTDALAGALRRASANLASMTFKFQLAGFEAERALTAHDADAIDLANADSEPTPEELSTFVQKLLKYQQNRARFFDPELFSGPSWDILLDLAAASFRGEPVAASSVCATTLVPFSTALRHVNSLVEAGLVRRWTDPTDKRRKMLELEPEASAMMKQYLETGWKMQHR